VVDETFSNIVVVNINVSGGLGYDGVMSKVDTRRVVVLEDDWDLVV